MDIAQDLAAAVTILSALAFAVYIAGMAWLPTGERPLIHPADRTGRPLPATENPDFSDTEEEVHSK